MAILQMLSYLVSIICIGHLFSVLGGVGIKEMGEVREEIGGRER
jgi:hypothetical protein